MSGAAAPLDEPAAAAPTSAAARGPTLAALAGLAVFLCAVWVPALWLDEATTIVLIRRSWSELVSVGVNADPALLPYYVLVKPLLDLTGEMWTVRLASVGAAALCVGGVLLFARRALGDSVAVTAAAVVVVLPVMSLYAQQARPHAIALAAVTLAMAAWWRAGPEDGGRLWWAAYAVALVATALANVLALVVVLAPLAAAAALPAARRRAVLRRSALVPVLVGAVLSPYAYLVLTRAKGVASPPPVALDTVWGLVSHPLGGGVVGGLLLMVGVAAAGLLLRDSCTRVAGALLTVWAFAPSLALVALAIVGRPTLVPRYAVIALPALAVLLAAGLVRLAALMVQGRGGERMRRIVPLVGVGVLVVVLLPQSLAYRAPDGHGEDIRPALTALEAESAELAVVANRVSLLTVQAYAPLLVSERMPQIDDPSPHAEIAPTHRLAAEVAPELAAADSVLLLARRTPSSPVPIRDSLLPEGLRGRQCVPTVLAVSSGWISERIDCPPRT